MFQTATYLMHVLNPKRLLGGRSRPELRLVAGADPRVAVLDRLQCCHTELCFPHELAIYYSREVWLRAGSVLDVGCGTGYYLHWLAHRFDEKQYVGVDPCTSFIAAAERRRRSPSVNYYVDSLETVEGEYDFIILRLLLSELNTLDGVLDRLAGLSQPGGHCLIIDGYHPARNLYPALPPLRSFAQRYVDAQGSGGIVQAVKARAAQHDQWTLSGDWLLRIPSALPGNPALFARTFSLLVESVREDRRFQCDDRLAQAWLEWASNPQAYAEAHLSALLLTRSAG